MFAEFSFHDYSTFRAIEILTGKPTPCFEPLATGENETFRSDRLDHRTGEKDSFLEFHWIGLVWFGWLVGWLVD
jgi:hypothetical protein